MKRLWFAAVAGSIVLGSAVYMGARPQPTAQNILVVSACSLRIDRLGAYNPDYKRSPRLDDFARSAFVFDHAFAAKPWQNWSFDASDIVVPGVIQGAGYAGFPLRPRRNLFYIPPVERVGTEGGDEWYWSEDAILRYQQSYEEMRQALTRPREKPFYAFVHLKYMHYPYLDHVNMGDKEWRRLSPESLALLHKYRGEPGKYDAQLPVVSVMLNSFDFLKSKFGVEGNVLSAAGVISDPAHSRRWRATPGYEKDLKLLNELYDLKMDRFDPMAAEVLNLFGDPELQARTIVIFTGDHGEAFMEHGVLGHSVNVYDEMLRYPLMVKFPGMKGGERLSHLVNHEVMAKLVKEIMEGRISKDSFARRARELSPDVLLSRNCADTIRSARDREWKFIKNLDSGRDELYNLTGDPHERENLIEAHPDVAWRLEEKLLDRQEQLLKPNRFETLSRVCLTR